MTLPLTVAPAQGFTSFLDFPVHTDLETLEAEVAILGIPYGAPYAMDQVANDQSRAPGAIRAQSGQIGDGLDRWGFGLGGPLFGGPLFDGREVRVVDCGDVPGDPFDLAGTYERAQAAARAGSFERNATRWP